jgi:hypothetical protein
VKTTAFSGQQLAQIDNPDPFAPPVWRSPVYHTPGWVITIVQLCRALCALAKFLARHPVLDLVLAVEAFAWRLAGWPGPVILTSTVTTVLVIWRLRWPESFARCIATPSVASGGAGITSGTGWPC